MRSWLRGAKFVSVGYVAEDDGGIWGLPVKYPVELPLPAGFDPDRSSTWPRVNGRLEYIGGRLLFMPPCGETQSTVVANLVRLVGSWARANPDFRAGTNEAGMKLRGDVRGADAAIWPRRKGSLQSGYSETAPLWAAEVEGQDEDEKALREKARWYLENGTKTVWLVLSARREIVVITACGESRFGPGMATAEHPQLPGLAVPVDEVFFGL